MYRVIREGTAQGKIILSGEYAMVFGYPGIAVPAMQSIRVQYKEKSIGTLKSIWPEIEKHSQWKNYMETIIKEYCKYVPGKQGELHMQNAIPLGKGMGSSTALVISIGRCLLGSDCREEALTVEDTVNPGHSGMDFSVIWDEKPIVFSRQKGAEECSKSFDLTNGYLIDTGLPNQQTGELIVWVKQREQKLKTPLRAIGECTQRLLQGEDVHAVIHDHHRAQVELGIVPIEIQKFIESIENAGGAAKVIGAGARTGGAGMVLALGIAPNILQESPYPYFPIHS